MDTTDIQRCLVEKASIEASNILEKASIKASNILETNYIPKQSLCEYLEHIDKEFLYKEAVCDVYLDYVKFCDKNIKPMTRTAFSRTMIQCGFRIKPMKKNKKVVRCFYY